MSKVEQIVLPDTLKIDQAHSLHDEFEVLLSKESTVGISIDAGAVTVTDTAGVQLIAALVNSAKELHMQTNWSGVSSTFRNAAQSLGLQNILEINQ